MACQGCIARQTKWVKFICNKKPDGKLCRKAKARLERMQSQQPEKK